MVVTLVIAGNNLKMTTLLHSCFWLITLLLLLYYQAVIESTTKNLCVNIYLFMYVCMDVWMDGWCSGPLLYKSKHSERENLMQADMSYLYWQLF